MARPRHSRHSARQPLPGQGKALVMLLSWLIPGYGFFHHGLRSRALLFFLTLQGTFLVGAALHGSVLLPELNPRSEGFNLVTILTFLVQMCNGLLALISLLPDLFGPGAAILPYDETHPLAELGSFYLLVSGGMNYFVLVSTWDHFYGSKRAGQTQVAQPAPAAPRSGEEVKS